jgi:hypothetical protein
MTANTWVVAIEVPDENPKQRYRSLPLAANATQQDYWFVTRRRFGAQPLRGLNHPKLFFVVCQDEQRSERSSLLIGSPRWSERPAKR